jgi:alkylation response protein AidB-like acyl-CoA dehydrogenase
MTALPAQEMGPAANAFRQEVRDWLTKNWTPEKRAAHSRKPFKDRGHDSEFSKLMGRDGWIGVGWPKEFGGQGRGPTEQIVFITEVANSGAPAHAHNTSESIVAQALFLHGTKAQQDEWLPAIRRGERFFALGYSEPEAGSDLAALRTRAVRDGDDWIVNGQKLWSTGADKADHMWLAVRTDPEAKKHAGISVLMVDLRTPGITIRPSMAMYGKTFSTHFYDNVRVPAKNMVGAVNNGWKVITDALASERVMIGGTRIAALERIFDQLTEYLKTAVVGGKALRNDPVIRDRIGALAADLEVARQFQIRNSRLVEQGRVPLHEAAMGKVFASELQERLGQAALDILGTGGLLSEDADGAPVGGQMEQVLRHSIMGMIGGGTSEIQRNVIAQRGLDLPR